MTSLSKSYRDGFLFLAAVVMLLLNIGLTNAQASKKDVLSREMKSDVEAKKGNLLNVEFARLEKITTQENKISTEMLSGFNCVQRGRLCERNENLERIWS
jgi:hypothetical protein